MEEVKKLETKLINALEKLRYQVAQQNREKKQCDDILYTYQRQQEGLLDWFENQDQPKSHDGDIHFINKSLQLALFFGILFVSLCILII